MCYKIVKYITKNKKCVKYIETNVLLKCEIYDKKQKNLSKKLIQMCNKNVKYITKNKKMCQIY